MQWTLLNILKMLHNNNCTPCHCWLHAHLKSYVHLVRAMSASRLCNTLCLFLRGLCMCVAELMTCGATRNPEFPRTGPDRTETGPGSGNILMNIFGSSRVGEFYFGSVRVGEFYFGSVRVGEFYFGSVRVGVFFTGAWDIFSRDFGDKLAFHFQTVEVEWLLSLISTLFDVITSLQDIFTCLL